MAQSVWIRLADSYHLHVLQSIYTNKKDESRVACIDQNKAAVFLASVSVSHQKSSVFVKNTTERERHHQLI